MEAVWTLEATSTQKFVLLAMAWFADDSGGRVYPSVGRLAERCALNRRTVQRTIREAEQAGWVEAIAPASQHQPITYRLTISGAAQDRSGTGPQRQEIPPGAALSTARGGPTPPNPSVTVRNRKSTGSRFAPPTFLLDADNLQIASAVGLSEADARWQFAKFADHEFPRAYTDWKRTWRNWCRGALERRAGGRQAAGGGFVG